MKSFLRSVTVATRCKINARQMASTAGKPLQPNDVVVLSGARTPMGMFLGAFNSIPPQQLGAIVIKEAIKRAGLAEGEVDEVYMGQAIQAGSKQGPARQAAIKAGLPWSVICTTVNKLCASSMKAAIFATQSIRTGQQDVVLAGGFESSSHLPYLLTQARSGGYRLGHATMYDSGLHDGLIDPYANLHMGQCADLLAKNCGVTRAEQDAYAMESYKRAMAAIKTGHLQKQIVPVEIPPAKKGQAGKLLELDETLAKFDAKKIPTLKPAFTKNGTVTAANASPLNDAASAIVLSSWKWAQEHGKKPLAVVRGFGDAEQESKQFLTSPVFAIPKALKMAGLTMNDVDIYEINEAFSVAVIVCARMLKLDMSKINLNGGAVVLGHPVGSSGTRIIQAMLTAMEQKNKTFAAAGICNGGGGASAMVIERLK